MRRTGVAVLLMGAFATSVVGCTSKSSQPTTTRSQSSPAINSGDSSTDASTVAVYSELLTKTHEEVGGSWAPVYVSMLPAGAQPGIPASVRGELSARLRDSMTIHWVARPPQGGNYVFVALPRISPGQDRFRVDYSDVCGNLCGHGIRYLITRRGDAWKIRQVGPTAIS